MEYGTLLSNSFEYTKECLVGKWMKWILLIISTIIFPLIYGYVMRIYKGTTPAPELENWGGLFIDGIKLLIVGIVYFIPVFIVAALVGVGSSLTAMAGGDMAALGTMGIGMLVLLILTIIIALIVPIAYIRFSRMESFGEAFNFSAIFGHIGKIGWVDYIIAIIILGIVIGIIQFVLMLIPILGRLLLLILMPAFAIFSARYMTLVYDSAA
ncbi:MAG: Uncharacterized protein XE11_1120 [Methanomicrobiales archaeon 53_19]|nr:DUF4013 domain-containing protein [Methanocalculus sp.]KUK71369.1 MAG: Uncharacterized protein XD88_0058 [Methanocalculus sp. 52_23]KUL03695.1 MAG: Uncharacterized protein XE11_1120 [Methanomicrobiales archaeon 53_19]HIJ06273.1 DUF4013 domain-containing protein [Methanocalculus sp.]